MIDVEAERSVLGPKTLLDKGAVGAVYQLDRYRIPGFGALAYKEYFTEPSADEARNVRELVSFRASLPAGDRGLLDEVAAWPVQVVVERGQVCGLVMQLIPPEFFSRQKLPSGKIKTVTTKAQWLVIDSARAARDGVVVPEGNDVPARLVLCAKLAHLFGTLHRGGLTYGDLSLNNVMFCGSMPPRIMLVDCDAIKTPAVPALRQLHTPGWRPPEAVSGAVQDPGSDAYKLALFILRCLTPGHFASQATDPDRVGHIFDARGMTMLRAAVGANRAARPTASEWYAYLVDLLVSLTSPPSFEIVEVDEQVVLEGHPVTVRWRTTGQAESVSLMTPDGNRRQSPGPATEGQFVVSPARSGVFELSAHNVYGTATARSPIVHVMNLPRVEQITLPATPPLPAVALGGRSPSQAVVAALSKSPVNLALSPPASALAASIDLSSVIGDAGLQKSLTASLSGSVLLDTHVLAGVCDMQAESRELLQSIRLDLSELLDFDGP